MWTLMVLTKLFAHIFGLKTCLFFIFMVIRKARLLILESVLKSEL